ncbi:SHOCT domain-containing protein [Haloarcula laminariae]|uniref:SHOCT domain-containing protein n=1 Tax=Haloarcula laminariae TaxID=2961577 RepID=UPI0021C8E532|nr:SHOCT domain-containing protein [Halomicroarcula laminariae]
MTADEEEDPLASIVAGSVTALTFLVGFGLMFVGVPYFWVAFPVGFGGLLPAAMGATRLYQRRREADGPTSEDDPLATLRDRYARGELSDAEFERQVERLLETEDAETVRDPSPPDSSSPAVEPDRETE